MKVSNGKRFVDSDRRLFTYDVDCVRGIRLAGYWIFRGSCGREPTKTGMICIFSVLFITGGLRIEDKNEWTYKWRSR